VLQGDLATTALPDVLRMLADGDATGCLHVVDPVAEAAQIYLRDGCVYAVKAAGTRPQLGDRLVTSGALTPEALGEALEAQRTELQGWRMGELLVHLSLVDQAVVEDFLHQQIRATLSELLGWQHATWKFRVNQRTREDVVPPVPVEQLLHDLSVRRADMAAMQQVLHGPDAVPSLSAADTASSQTEIDADAWSLLCKVDGTRTVADLARDCGFTMYEAGLVVVALVQAGLLEVDEPEHQAAAVEPEPDTRQIAGSLLAAFGGAVPDQRAVVREDDLALPSFPAKTGPVTASDDVFGAPVHRPSLAELHRQAEERKRLEREQRAAARRAADAAELAHAQEELEAAKAAAQATFAALHGEDHVADVVDLGEVRAASEAEAARVDEQALEAAAADQARLNTEQAEQARLAAEAEQARLAAEEAEQARLAAEQAEQARLAAEEAERIRLAEEAEQARLAAEQAEQDRLAVEAEQARLAAEEAEQVRLAAEEAEQARLAAEEAEQARLAAEETEQVRLAAEEAEQARLAAEEAEQARLAAEEAEQARLATEEAERIRLAEEAEQARLAAEEAERIRLVEEAEQARLAAELAEQDRLAAEEAERIRAAEAAEQDRLAAEAEQARLAAEDAERIRVVEEAEQARLAAEQAHLAAEAEQDRLAAEAEQARLAEEAEQARLAAEAEQARLAAEAEQARFAAEEAERTRLADEAQQARLAAEGAERIRLVEEAEQARLAEEQGRAGPARRRSRGGPPCGGRPLGRRGRAGAPRGGGERARIAAESEAQRQELEEQWAAVPATTGPDEDTASTRAARGGLRRAERVGREHVPEVPTPRTSATTPAVQDRYQDEEPFKPFVAPDTDTAALLRELSSLGLDDDPPPPPPVRPAPPRPVSTLPAAKKRKGLFGR
jgi:hypothetical protein